MRLSGSDRSPVTLVRRVLRARTALSIGILALTVGGAPAPGGAAPSGPTGTTAPPAP